MVSSILCYVNERMTHIAIVFVLTWEFSNLTPTQNSFAESIKRIAPAAFVLPVVTNVFITALILYRIISTRAAVRRFTSIHDDHIYRTVITNVVESCLIYPVVLIVALILYLCNSNGQDVVSLFRGSLEASHTELSCPDYGSTSPRYDCHRIKSNPLIDPTNKLLA